MQDRWRDVCDSQTVDLAATRDPVSPGAKNENSILRMVSAVGAGVVLERVYLSVSNSADRSPVQVAKINNQVRRDAAHFFIQFLRSKNLSADFLSVFIGNALQSRCDFLPHFFVIVWCNGSVRLTACNIEKNARVITAIAPRFCSRPINLGF